MPIEGCIEMLRQEDQPVKGRFNTDFSAFNLLTLIENDKLNHRAADASNLRRTQTLTKNTQIYHTLRVDVQNILRYLDTMTVEAGFKSL